MRKITAIFLQIFIINLVQSETNYFKEEKDLLPCSYFNTVNITDGVKSADGSIIYKGITYWPHSYTIYDYHYTSYSKKIDVPKQIRGCVCDYTTCIRMCCPEGYVYHVYNRTHKCQFHEKYLDFNVVLTHPNKSETIHDLTQHQVYSGITGRTCSGYFLEPDLYEEEQWSLLSDGRLFLNHTSNLKYHGRDHYCLAKVFSNENQSEPILRALKCVTDKEVASSKPNLVHSIALIISVPFLLATLIVYAWIEELRATVRGKNLMCYVAGLAIAYSFLAAAQIGSIQIVAASLCGTFAYVIQISLTVSFFWLNVISFDIWWTVGSSKGGKQEERRFLKYATYACGSTVLIILLEVILDNTEIVPSEFRPGFGVVNCWIQNTKTAQFFHLYLLVIVIISINMVLFGLSANKIRLIHKQAAETHARGESLNHSKMQSDRDKFCLYFRLFIIMGVTWSMEALSWIVDSDDWIFYITDFCNCIQGLSIFLLFVCSSSVRSAIRKKFRVMQGHAPENSASRTNISHMSGNQMTTLEKNEANKNHNVNSNINSVHM